MKIQVNNGDIESSEALTRHVLESVDDALGRFADRLTRVEVHLRDDKQKRDGPDDKRCTMEVRPAGAKPMTVDAKGGDMYAVVKDCAGKVERSLARKFDRQQARQ